MDPAVVQAIVIATLPAVVLGAAAGWRVPARWWPAVIVAVFIGVFAARYGSVAPARNAGSWLPMVALILGAGGTLHALQRPRIGSALWLGALTLAWYLQARSGFGRSSGAEIAIIGVGVALIGTILVHAAEWTASAGVAPALIVASAFASASSIAAMLVGASQGESFVCASVAACSGGLLLGTLARRTRRPDGAPGLTGTAVALAWVALCQSMLLGAGEARHFMLVAPIVGGVVCIPVIAGILAPPLWRSRVMIATCAAAALAACVVAGVLAPPPME